MSHILFTVMIFISQRALMLLGPRFLNIAVKDQGGHSLAPGLTRAHCFSSKQCFIATQTCSFVYTVCGSFCITMAELSICDRNCTDRIFTMWSFTEKASRTLVTTILIQVLNLSLISTHLWSSSSTFLLFGGLICKMGIKIVLTQE